MSTKAAGVSWGRRQVVLFVLGTGVFCSSMSDTLNASSGLVIPAVLGTQTPSVRMAAVLKMISDERILSKDVLGQRLAAAPSWCFSGESRPEVYFLIRSAFIPDQPRHAIFLSATGDVVIYRMSGMDGRVEWFSLPLMPDKSLQSTAHTPPAADGTMPAVAATEH